MQQFADVLLNESSWDHVMIGDGLASHLADGANSRNVLGRIEMLCHKLARIPDDDMALGQLRHESAGSVSDAHSVFPHDRTSVLLGCLTKMIHSAWEWHPAEVLLEPLQVLPAALRDRYRAWVLANAANASVEAMTAEVEQAIARRDATGDDAALVDRALEDVADRDDLVRRWREAMGVPPSVAETSRVLGADGQVPKEWFRAETWVALLPAEATEPWIGPCRVLAARYGDVTRESLLQRSTVESRSVDSPYTAAELNSMTPVQAAVTISRWRPAPNDYQLGALELARELKGAIQEAPESWLSDPLNIAATLRHPLYIGHYLRGAAECADAAQQNIDGLVDVIELVGGEPWPAANLGERFFEAGWRNAHAAAVDLIAAFCRSGAVFGERADDVWAYLEATARNLPELPGPSEGPHTAEQARTRAINRVSTRALEAALLFIDRELRDSRPLRPQFEQLLDLALRLEGNDGAEYRAALAPNVLWLRQRMPEWSQANLENLYGADAPDELGRLTFDVTVQSGRFDKWLLETYSHMLQDAAVRGTRNALQFILIGMLRHRVGYTIAEVVNFLQEHRELIGQTAGLLPNLLRQDDIEQADLDTGMELWQALLDSAAANDLSEFGWMSQVEALDDDIWSQLTLQTLSATGGRIDWARQVAERAMKAPVTLTKIMIVKEIVQGETDPWTLSRITDNIEELLDAAGELRDSDEYARLRTALQERDLID